MQQKIFFNANSPAAEETTFRDLVDKYLHYWPWFLLVTFLCLTIGFVYLKLATPSYKAVASIIIKDEENSQANMSVYSDIGLMSGLATNSIANELGLLKSKRLMNNTVAALDLNVQYFVEDSFKNKEIFSESPFKISVLEINNKQLIKASSIEKNFFYLEGLKNNKIKVTDLFSGKTIVTKLGDKISLNYISFVVNINDLDAEDTFNNVPLLVKVRPIESVSSAYKANLEIDLMEENSTLISLSVTDPIKLRAEDVLNQLILEYNTEAIEDKNLVAENTAKFIDDRLKIINKELDSVEEGKEIFKEKNKLTNIQVESALFIENASDYDVKIQEVNTQLGLVSAMLSYLKKEGGDLLPSNLGIEESNINTMIGEYNSLVLERNRILAGGTESNPVVIRLNFRIDQLKDNIEQSLIRKRANLNISLRDLKRQSGTIGGQISQVPQKERLFRSIERQQNVKETLYLFLLQKREENSLSLAATSPKAKIVDRAYASMTPISPNSKLVLFVAFLAGLIVPFLGINLKDLLNNKINSKEDIEAITKEIPIIGQLPKILASESNIVKENDRSILSETLRILVSNLHFFFGSLKTDSSKIIFVTSTVKGEGKTFTTVNLAKMLAINEKRVIIVGADLRNPRLHMFEKDVKQNKGLSNYLVDNTADIKELVCDTSLHKNLKILPSGPIPPNPAELLGKPKMALFFEELKQKFDFIVVDTPPSMILADTFLITQYSDLVLYMVRAGMTEKKLIGLPEQAKKEGKFKNIAFVINDLKFKDFGYGNKYGYTYGQSLDDESRFKVYLKEKMVEFKKAFRFTDSKN